MELTILHLCPDMMNLYGEYANTAVLRRRLEMLGVTVTVEEAPCGDRPDFFGADLVYMGAGTERKQKYALEALRPWREDLKEAIDRGAVLLFTGNAMETLGASVTDAGGTIWPCLGLADFTTVETEKRTPVDVVATPTLWEAPAVGFMNKCSVTRGVTTPLFSALPLGFGNDQEHGAEGYVSGNVFATHMTGPVLVKNPDFAEVLLRRLFARKEWDLPEPLPELPHQRAAYAVTLEELQKRMNG